MPILNKSNGTVIAETYEVCRNTWEKFRGMTFRPKVVPLVFQLKKAKVIRLHSWFCPANIDLILLDGQGKVLEVREGWEPYDYFTSTVPCQTLLELPQGSIRDSRTVVGDAVLITT